MPSKKKRHNRKLLADLNKYRILLKTDWLAATSFYLNQSSTFQACVGMTHAIQQGISQAMTDREKLVERVRTVEELAAQEFLRLCLNMDEDQIVEHQKTLAVKGLSLSDLAQGVVEMWDRFPDLGPLEVWHMIQKAMREDKK